MEEMNHPRTTPLSFRAVWAFWGVLTAFLITLSDRYITHDFESPRRILFRFAIFVALGVLLGPVMSKPLDSLFRMPRTKAAMRARIALFVGLMFAMACVLWFMAARR
jgi:hypothetical protein